MATSSELIEQMAKAGGVKAPGQSAQSEQQETEKSSGRIVRDQELLACDVAVRAVEDLDAQAQWRVICYLSSRYPSPWVPQRDQTAPCNT